MRYLWIDSLCIVQDDERDWEFQASRMASIYSCSLCILCALSSRNSTQGCRVNGQKQRFSGMERYCDIDLDGLRVRFFTGDPSHWHSECSGPLNSRAWTLQERELSRRKLYFSENMLLWECSPLKGSSELPWRHDIFSSEPVIYPVLDNYSEGLAPGGTARLRGRWYTLAEDYSGRLITKETDRLPALAGLARKYQDSFSFSNYIAGIWALHLPGALLWRSRGESRRPVHCRSPSWSWTSIEGSISYDSQRSDTYEQEVHVAEYSAKVISHGCRIRGSDPYGSIEDAWLTLRARLAHVQLTERPAVPKENSPVRYDRQQLVNADGSSIGVFFPDVGSEVRSIDRIYCLSIRKEAGEEDAQHDGLPLGS